MIGAAVAFVASLPGEVTAPTRVQNAVTADIGTDFHGLHVVGGTIQNAAGVTVQLRGVNRSSWEYTCLDESGRTHDGSADQTEINAMTAWKINAVRVVLNEDCWLGINGVTVGDAAYQTAVTSYVNLLTANNIVPIVNLHFSAPGTILAGKYTGAGGRSDQFPMADRDHSPAFWTGVANAFKDNSMVVFEPYNEPFPDNDNGGNTTAAWLCWRDGGTCPAVTGYPDYTNAGMQELVGAIRGTGATNVIILTGTNWGSELEQLLQYLPQDSLVPPQFVAGWHSYDDGMSCEDPSCWNTTLTSVVQQLPLVATEIGEFDCSDTYINQVMAFLDSNQSGYTAWVWGPYDCSDDPALIQDWSGTPTQTFGQGFHDHLAAAVVSAALRSPAPGQTLSAAAAGTGRPTRTATARGAAATPRAPTRTATAQGTATPLARVPPALR